MAKPQKTRVRRSPDEAKALFLQCAEELLISDGLGAVQMRAVARQANMTDAAVSHHFGNREGLLSALMDHIAQKVRNAIGGLAEAWSRDSADLLALVTALDRLYGKEYAQLAQALYHAGWRDRGTPILEPVAKTLIERNQNPRTQAADIRRVLATLHMDLALSPIYGDAFGRSAGLTASRSRTDHLTWWAGILEETLASDG